MALLARLHQLRHRYAAPESDEKRALIQRLERSAMRSATQLLAYHDDLLFLSAYPDDDALHGLALSALKRIERRVRALSRTQRRRLDDTGIAGTTTRHAFAFGIAQWMSTAGATADIDWASVDSPERIDPLLRLSLTQAESDAFDSGELSTLDWLELARGTKAGSTLSWLVKAAPSPRRGSRRGALGALLAQARPDPAVFRLLYESLELPVVWRPAHHLSVTGNRVDARPVRPRTQMRPMPPDPAALVTTPLTSIARQSRNRAHRWLDASRAALAVRCREVHAITYANPDEVYVADLGEGAELCLIGAAPADRLTLEANYGYVLFANGVPVGYGGVTPLAAQANTGVNIFDAFRHAEAGMLFTQALRAFRTLFGVTRFIVNPYQFGADNDEALASGAFWFYDRLGFRPTDATVLALAHRERGRIAARRTYRSPPSTLRRLAGSDLVLELGNGGAVPLFEERWLVTLAGAVTRALQAPDIAARLDRRDALVTEVAAVLDPPGGAAARAPFAFGLHRLGPVLSLVLPAIRRWPDAERRALADMVRAKGLPQEREFAIASREHASFWLALRRFCRREDAPAGRGR